MVSVVTLLPTGQSLVQIPVGERDFSVFQNAQTGAGVYPAFCLVGTRVFPWNYRGQSMKLTNDILLVLRLECSLTSTPLICLHNGGSENFTFCFNCLPSIRFLTSLTSRLSCNFTLCAYGYLIGNKSVLINRLLGMYQTQCACWFNL